MILSIIMISCGIFGGTLPIIYSCIDIMSMTRGRLGMIVCPMLEDEAIYNIKNDPEIDHVYLVTGAYNDTIIPKMRQHGVAYESISPTTALKGDFPKDEYNVIIWVMFMGLHEDLDMLKMEVTNQIITMFRSVDSIMLYYGRCGRGLDDICRWSLANIPIPVMIFRNRDGSICDDCICIPIGGTDRYLQLLRKYPGRLYFTPAMASNFEGFLSSMELFNGLDTRNTELMRIILDMAGYTEVMEVQTGIGDQENFHKNIDAFCEKYELDHTVIEEGWATKYIADMNYDNAKRTMVRWLDEGIKQPFEGEQDDN